VSWGGLERSEFIKEWHDRGYEVPRGGWTEYDIHHILPREFGGTNEFWNLVPVQRATHQQELNKFWRDM
jgi:filamentous hemagglutinin